MNMAEEEKKTLDSGSDISKSLSPAYECSSDVVMNMAEEDKKALDSGSDIGKSLSPASECSSVVVMEEEEASVVPAIGLSIGSYSRFTGKDVSVTACFSYGAKRLQWDIVEGPLRRRLVVQFNFITGLELKLNESGLACLTIEMKYAPYCQIYTPKKAWIQIRDFTDGEIYRNVPPHCVLFKPETVDKSCEKLLNCLKEIAIEREKRLKRFNDWQLRQLQERYRLQEKEHRRQLQKLSMLSSEKEKEENK